jgi:hypothetical protein
VKNGTAGLLKSGKFANDKKEGWSLLCHPEIMIGMKRSGLGDQPIPPLTDDIFSGMI